MNEIFAIIESRLVQKLPLEPDTPLLSSGLIDSFGVGELIIEFEKQFHIRINPAEIGVDNFDTPAQIHNYVKTHLRGDSNDGGQS
jgi:acyl carrier protein